MVLTFSGVQRDRIHHYIFYNASFKHSAQCGSALNEILLVRIHSITDLAHQFYTEIVFNKKINIEFDYNFVRLQKRSVDFKTSSA